MIDLVGDIHVKKDNLDKQGLLFEKIEASENMYVILTGDLLDNKSIVKSECLNFLYEKLRTSRKTFWIIIGNHDQHHLGTLKHSLEPLKALPNVNIIDKTTEFAICNLQIVGIPYLHDSDEFAKEVKSIKNKKDKILLCHQGFTGFDYGNGYIAKEESDLKSIKAFSMVYVGHFHKFQTFKNGCYIGTPFTQSFGESNQTKYIGEINEKGDLKLIETDFPKHMTHEIDCDEEFEGISLKHDDYNRIILTGSKESIEDFDTSKFIGVKILKRPLPENAGKNVEISEALSNVKKFEYWAKEVGQMTSNTIQLGISILRNVS